MTHEEGVKNHIYELLDGEGIFITALRNIHKYAPH